MNVVRNIVRGFKAEIGARVLYYATTGATIVFLARFLSPGTYGLVFLALSILSVGRLMGTLGIPGSVARFVAEYDDVDPARVGYMVTFSFVAVLGLSALVAVLLVTYADRIASVFDEPSLAPAIVVGAGLIVSSTLYRFFRKVLQGFKLVGQSAAIYGFEGVGRIVFVVLFVLAGFGAAGALGGYTLGFLSGAAVGALVFYRRVYPQIEVTLEGEREIRDRVLEYAIALLTTRGAKVADNRLDTILVGILLGPAAVGFYGLSKQAVHLVQAPASSVGFSTGPWLGNQKASGNVERIASIYASLLVYTLLLYIPAAAGLALLAGSGIEIVFGQGYVPAVEILQILSLLVVLLAVEEVSENSIDYLGRARGRSIAKSVTALFTLGAIVVLVPPLGLVGVAVAKVAAHVVYVGGLLYIMYTEVDLSAGEIARNVALILTVTGVMSGVVLLAARFISGPVTLSGVVVLGATVWAALSVSLGLVDAERVASLLQ